MDQVNTQAWVGRAVSDQGGVDPSMAAKIHATIGRAGTPTPRLGDPLPPLWHWSAFPPVAHMDRLGADGHPGAGDLMPPLRLPRRMWGGGELRFFAPLRIGDPMERHTSIRAIEEKQTSAGAMALVTLDHTITGPCGVAIQERQDIVYLPMPETFSPPKKREMPAGASEAVETSPALLFRYSAVTFNAHRIHYDLDYARHTEKYPGLVVHGPLQATMMMRHAVAKKGRTPEFFDFRAVHPLFAGTALDICTTEDDGVMSILCGQDGHQGMRATAIWEETQ